MGNIVIAYSVSPSIAVDAVAVGGLRVRNVVYCVLGSGTAMNAIEHCPDAGNAWCANSISVRRISGNEFIAAETTSIYVGGGAVMPIATNDSNWPLITMILAVASCSITRLQNARVAWCLLVPSVSVSMTGTMASAERGTVGGAASSMSSVVPDAVIAGGALHRAVSIYVMGDGSPPISVPAKFLWLLGASLTNSRCLGGLLLCVVLARALASRLLRSPCLSTSTKTTVVDSAFLLQFEPWLS